MLVCVCFVHFAHETAGAARTRSSLRPLFFWRDTVHANLGQIAPRECGLASSLLSSPRMRGIQYTTASRLKHGLWNTGSPAFAGDDKRKLFDIRIGNRSLVIASSGSDDAILSFFAGLWIA